MRLNIVRDLVKQLTDPRYGHGILVSGCLVPRRLSLKRARKGRREGDNGRDVWQILFSRWREE